ncbi:hypothetical protein ABS71_05940 [bacterium SCN 62-11]|nr:hypothetical protein [Candidatus Eremiobacteraeota bacterium]ODT74208.1 MAG: hypothetical protein ABS71_05940 [bacterium SCN 62-11]
MRTLDQVASDLHWCAPWALTLFQDLLAEYRQLLQEQPEEKHLEQLRIYEGRAPGRRRQCHPPVALARPGLEAIVRQEVLRRGRRLAQHLDSARLTEGAEVRALLRQFEQQQPERRGLDGLPHLLRTLRRQGAQLVCHLRSWPLELPDLLSEIAYEIVAEGLRNALRHGDGSQRVALQVELRDRILRLEIRNPIRGALKKSGSGLGLRHLRWRVGSCHGRYRFLQQGRQVRLQVRLPLPDDTSEDPPRR